MLSLFQRSVPVYTSSRSCLPFCPWPSAATLYRHKHLERQPKTESTAVAPHAALAQASSARHPSAHADGDRRSKPWVGFSLRSSLNNCGPCATRSASSMRTVTCALATKPPENHCRIAIIPALASIRSVVFVAHRRTKNVFFAEDLDHPARHGALSLQDKSRPLGSATSHASPSESPWQATYRIRLRSHRFPAGENSLAHVTLWVVLWVAFGHYSYYFYFSDTY